MLFDSGCAIIKLTFGDALGIALAKQAVQSGNNDSTLLGRYMKMFNESWGYAESNYHKRWANNWKLYNNKRVHRSHKGVVDAFVPMVRSTVDTIIASLFGSNPMVNYIPNHPDQEADTKVLNEMYADFARRDNWVQKNKANGRQGVITGNLCAYYEYVPDKSGGYVHKVNVPVRDMIIDPHSHGLDDCEYVGRRLFASKTQLEQEVIYDAETGKQVKRYKNLEQVSKDGNGAGLESDKQTKDQVLGSTVSSDSNQIELIEIWTHKRVVVIANRRAIIEDRENPYYTLAKAQYEQRKTEHEYAKLKYAEEKLVWDNNREMRLQATGEDTGDFQGEPVGEFDEIFDEKHAGLLPFAHGRMYQDISLPYGDGDVDIIADMQELLNELTNLSIEAGLYTVFPEKTIDPKYAGNADDLDPFPGKIYPIPDGAMSWNNPPQIPANIFNERINIKDEMREATAVSQISKGVTATDNTTATEIKATLGRGDSRIQEKAQTLANDFFAQEASIVLKLVQLYAPDELWVRTTQDANVSFEQINPRKFLGEYAPMVTLDVQKKLEESEARENMMQVYQMLIADPTNNLTKIKEYCLPKILPDFTPEQITEMTTPAQTEAAQGSIVQALPEQSGDVSTEIIGETL